MTTIGMHYEVIPGKEEEFEKGFLNVIEHLKTVAGHQESHLYEDVSSTGSYLILSQWTTREDFNVRAGRRPNVLRRATGGICGWARGDGRRRTAHRGADRSDSQSAIGS